MNNKQKLMLISVFSLIFVNWLSINELMGARSIREWVMVLGTISTFMYFVDDLTKTKNKK